jgi:hypothetical protein
MSRGWARGKGQSDLHHPVRRELSHFRPLSIHLRCRKHAQDCWELHLLVRFQAGGPDVSPEDEFGCPTCRGYTWVFAFALAVLPLLESSATKTIFLAARSDPVNSSPRLSQPSPFAAPNSRSHPKFDHSLLLALLPKDPRATLPQGRPHPRPNLEPPSPPNRRSAPLLPPRITQVTPPHPQVTPFHWFAASLCLFALFFKLPPFVFNRLQPLFAKHPGWGVPSDLPSFIFQTFRRSDLPTIRPTA